MSDTENTMTEENDTTPEGAESLGDAGKRALDAMKSKWRAERDARKALEARIAELEGKSTAEPADMRVLRAEIKAAAVGKLADPADAYKFLDLESLDADDTDAIAQAVDALLEAKPYLAAKPGSRFQGTGDGGAAGTKPVLPQLTREDLKNMTPAQINEAKRAGQLNNLLKGA